MQHTSIPIIGVLFIILSIFYYCLFQHGFFPIQQSPHHTADITAFTNHSFSTQFDQYGQLEQAVKVTHSEHFNSPVSTTFTQPQFTLPASHHTVWYITAKSGQSFQSGNKILLWDDVNLHRPQKGDYVDTLIKTANLQYNKTKRLAISHSLTTIIQPGNTASGDYVRLNMKNNVIHIQKDAQGVFAAPKAKTS